MTHCEIIIERQVDAWMDAHPRQGVPNETFIRWARELSASVLRYVDPRFGDHWIAFTFPDGGKITIDDEEYSNE